MNKKVTGLALILIGIIIIIVNKSQVAVGSTSFSMSRIIIGASLLMILAGVVIAILGFVKHKNDTPAADQQ